MKTKFLPKILLGAVCGFMAFNAGAQNPGGVSVAAWWRADQPDLYSDAGTTLSTDSS